MSDDDGLEAVECPACRTEAPWHRYRDEWACPNCGEGLRTLHDLAVRECRDLERRSA